MVFFRSIQLTRVCDYYYIMFDYFTTLVGYCLFLSLGLLKHRNTHVYWLYFYMQRHQRNPRPPAVMTQGVATWKTWRR